MAPRGLQGVDPAGLDPQHRGLRLQFPDAVGRGELVQVVDELVRALQSVCHGVAGLGGQSVGLQPHVGVVDPAASRARVMQQPRRGSMIAAFRGHESKTAERQALPAWVADFNGERVRVVKQLCCLVDAAFVQLDLRDPGERVGRKCEPARLLRELLGPLQILSSFPGFVPEQMESAEVGEGHGRRAHVCPVLGMPNRVEQEGMAFS